MLGQVGISSLGEAHGASAGTSDSWESGGGLGSEHQGIEVRVAGFSRDCRVSRGCMVHLKSQLSLPAGSCHVRTLTVLPGASPAVEGKLGAQNRIMVFTLGTYAV